MLKWLYFSATAYQPFANKIELLEMKFEMYKANNYPSPETAADGEELKQRARCRLFGGL